MLTTYVLWWLILAAVPHNPEHSTRDDGTVTVTALKHSATADVDQTTARGDGPRTARLVNYRSVLSRP